MKIAIDNTKKPVRVKVRNCPAIKKIIGCIFRWIGKDGLSQSLSTSIMAGSSPFGTIASKAKYRTTIDLRPVNAATKAKKWPIPIIEAELSNFNGSTHFASRDICSGYRQCLLKPESYEVCGIIAPQRTFVSTLVLHGLQNSADYFHSTIPPLFDNMRHAIKPWIDDFTLHTGTESQLLEHLSKLCNMCSKHNLYLSAKTSVLYIKEVK